MQDEPQKNELFGLENGLIKIGVNSLPSTRYKQSLKTTTQSHSEFFCKSTKPDSTWINLGLIPANTMHPASVVLMLARHLRRRSNIKTPFVFCHVFAGMDTMAIYSTHHVEYIFWVITFCLRHGTHGEIHHPAYRLRQIS